jgi:DNA-3-methyladenine glycosylase II
MNPGNSDTNINLGCNRRGMAAYVGRDVSKLKAKGGKWKYMSEQDMLDISEKFAPYR